MRTEEYKFESSNQSDYEEVGRRNKVNHLRDEPRCWVCLALTPEVGRI